MNKPRICLSIIENNPEAIRKIEAEVDWLEVRLDILKDDWRKVAASFSKP